MYAVALYLINPHSTVIRVAAMVPVAIHTQRSFQLERLELHRLVWTALAEKRPAMNLYRDSPEGTAEGFASPVAGNAKA